MSTTQLLAKGTYKVLMPDYELNEMHAVIRIEGDLMAPEIKHGAYVLAETILMDQYKRQKPGVYAVLYSDGFVVSRLVKNELINRHELQLVNDNEKFGSITIPESDILGMWKVLMKVQERVS